MYFITNKEGLIIAISSDFLNLLGSREICSINSMIVNQVITLDDDNNLTIPSKELHYKYTKNLLMSAFGELYLYSLEEVKEKELEVEQTEDIKEPVIEDKKDIKIKDEDDEFSIPSIPTLKKEEKSEDENVDLIKEIESLNKSETEEEKPKDIKEEIKEVESLKEEKLEEPKEVNIESIIEEEEEKSSKAKESVLSKFTKKIFPWGKKQDKKDIEIEFEEPKEIDLKPANELLEDAEVKKEVKIDEDKDIVVEPQDKEIEVKKEIKSDLEALKEEEKESIENIEEEIKKLDEPIIKEEKEEANKELEALLQISKDDKKEDIKQDLKDIKILDEQESEVSKAVQEIEDKKEIETDEVQELEKVEDKETENIEPLNEDLIAKIEQISKEELEEEEKEQLTKEETKEQLPQEEIKEEFIKEPTIKEATQEEEEEAIADNEIVFKLLKLQVDSISFDENAKKLNIDINSYKMLLDNYVSEIYRYKTNLENQDTSAINMLVDAGELLSIPVLSSKLKDLLNSSDTKYSMKEILHLAQLLKDKLAKSKEEEIKKEEPQPKEVEIEEPQEEQIDEIEKEVIELTDAKTLLEEIPANRVEFDPSKAAQDLNLPEYIIVDFIKDFINQSKDHIEIFIKHYKKNSVANIQTTAHMLKGAASNLRLDTISEILFKIQKETNLEQSGELIKEFVADIKGLENELKNYKVEEDEN